MPPPPVEPPDVPELRVPQEAMEAEEEILAAGGRLTAGWLLGGYRGGVFPMPHREDDGSETLYWYSPHPRGIFPLDGFTVSRSLRSAMRRHSVRLDTAFEEILVACARNDDPDHQWLTPEFADAYRELHRLGWAHSVEAWTLEGELAGGVLGVEVGGLFAGDTMVSFRTNGSKIALAGLVELLSADPVDRLFDTQWLTEHLATLGGVEVERREYHRLLAAALQRPAILADRAGNDQ